MISTEIPTYKSGLPVAKDAGSAPCQTLTPLEVLVCDDGSPSEAAALDLARFLVNPSTRSLYRGMRVPLCQQREPGNEVDYDTGVVHVSPPEEKEKGLCRS